jgi:hypothetical protein
VTVNECLPIWSHGLRGDDLWFPVHRSDDSGEFVLLSEWGADEQHARNRTEDTERTAGSWLNANPVVRYERLTVFAARTKRDPT